jgi:hypothetical protein
MVPKILRRKRTVWHWVYFGSSYGHCVSARDHGFARAEKT